MATLAGMISDARRHLYSGQRDRLNRLAADVAANATSLSFANDVADVAAGMYVAVDLEVFYVESVNATAKTAAVIPGQLGSVSDAHSSGALAYINPIVTDHQIASEINTELTDLSTAGLFRVVSREFTMAGGTFAYDPFAVGADVLDVLDVLWMQESSARPIGIRSWRLERDAPLANFPSGFALILDQGVPSGRAVTVTYKAGFGRFPLTTAGLVVDGTSADIGLPVTAQDIPPLGAAARVMMSREAKRTFTESQPEPRTAEEVPVGASTGVGRSLMALRDERARSESARLARFYPQRKPPVRI